MLGQPIFVDQLLVIGSIRCCGGYSASWPHMALLSIEHHGQPQYLIDEATKTFCTKWAVGGREIITRRLQVKHFVGRRRMQCTTAYAGSQGLGVHEVWRMILWCKADSKRSLQAYQSVMQHTCSMRP